MRIVFNALNTNLGNTGGCKTIVRSAHTLVRLGHIVTLAAAKNRYTWDTVKTVDKIPECDACIAVSVLDIESTLKQKAKTAYWMRGYEHWLKPKAYIKKWVPRIRTFANSSWLAEKFGAELLYAGMDLDVWKDMTIRMGNTIGCLYSKRDTKRYKDFIKLQKILGPGYRYLSLGKDGPVLGYDLVRFYNECDIWFAPSVLEGFHNPPAEAMLCGCLPIVSSDPRGGTGDYVLHGQTGLTYTDVELAAAQVDEYIKSMATETLVREGKELICSKIGSREQNMKRLVELL